MPFELIAFIVIIYLILVWFFSDHFDNYANAMSFTMLYIALCILGFIAFYLLSHTLQLPKN